MALPQYCFDRIRASAIGSLLLTIGLLMIKSSSAPVLAGEPPGLWPSPWSSNQRLVRATYLGDTTKITALLRAGADVNAQDQWGWTALITAVATDKRDVARLLLRHGASVSVRDVFGCTPLLRCPSAGMARLLLDHGADVNAADSVGDNALHLVMELSNNNHPGCRELVRLLVERGIHVNAANEWGRTSLFYAFFDSEAIVEFLLDHGANPNVQDKQGATPLMYVGGATGVQRILLRHGARVNVRDRTGATALHWSAMNDSIDSIQLLLQCGADINAADRWGQTPLSCALREGFGNPTAGFLREHGARKGTTWKPRLP